MKSSGGQAFTVFAKSHDWGHELYGRFVAKHLKTPLYTETWQNGVGRIPSWCKGSEYEQTVKNLVNVTFPDSDGWTETQDHSKWAVAQEGPYFCVGDINRQHGQKVRGGGTICIHDSSFAKQVRGTIDSSEDCTKVSDGAVTAMRSLQCIPDKKSYCCDRGVYTPCDCTKGKSAPGQCTPYSYAFCCIAPTPCDCSQPTPSNGTVVIESAIIV